MKDSPAIKIALAHAEAWIRHDWDTSRELPSKRTCFGNQYAA